MHFSREDLASISPERIKIKEAREIQRFIAKNIIRERVSEFKIVAGLDSAYSRDKVFTAISFFDVIRKEIIHEEYSIEITKFPYVPSLLFLREGPPMYRLAKKSKIKADVYLIDGHGEAHPYRAGLACYVGYLLDMPTIGVAKSRLFGRIEWENDKEGFLKNEEEIIGRILKICNKNFFISVGYKIDLQSATEIFKRCIEDCVPIPLRRAHILANNIRARYESGEISSSSS